MKFTAPPSSTPATPPIASFAQPALAGVLASLIGFASTFALVLSALVAAGASAAEAASGLMAMCLALCVLNIAFAWRTRLPISFAWSTPGAAFLLGVGTPDGGFPAVLGAFLATALMILLAGLFRPLTRLIAAIPSAIANAMLAGLLLPLCLAPFRAISELPTLALPIVLAWALGLRFFRRFAVPVAVLVTLVVLSIGTQLPEGIELLSWPTLTVQTPSFTLDALLRIAGPLFIVTMASQNLPGLAVMRANGFSLESRPLFLATGAASGAVAPFGGLSINLAAITAALAAGPESHPDPARRWAAPVAAGVGYLGLALLAGLAATFVAAAPPLLIEAVAGLALMTSLASALAGALADEETRLPAVLTFVTTASGLTALGIGSAFWGLLAGLGACFLLRPLSNSRMS